VRDGNHGNPRAGGIPLSLCPSKTAIQSCACSGFLLQLATMDGDRDYDYKLYMMVIIKKRLITEEPDAVFLGLPPLAACGADLPMVRLDERDVANISRLQMTPDAE
jgi:hypothetical protein